MDVLAALIYCHKGQLLHLDIKPQNILICYETFNENVRRYETAQNAFFSRHYVCKLCDFGASMVITQQAAKVHGTIRYMSPEALRAQQLTTAADIYSLAITMWQLQAGRLPYYWIDSNETVAYQVVKHNLRPDAQAVQRVTMLPVLHKSACLCAHACDVKTIEHLRNLIYGAEIVFDMKFDQFCNTTSGEHHYLSHNPNNKFYANYIFYDNGKEKSHILNTACLEVFYVNIYKSCWHSDSQLRLSSVELQNRLLQLLAQCIC